MTLPIAQPPMTRLSYLEGLVVGALGVLWPSMTPSHVLTKATGAATSRTRPTSKHCRRS